jgi:hypothetical protein
MSPIPPPLNGLPINIKADVLKNWERVNDSPFMPTSPEQIARMLITPTPKQLQLTPSPGPLSTLILLRFIFFILAFATTIVILVFLT